MKSLLATSAVRHAQGTSQMRTDAGFRTLLEAMKQRGAPQTPTVE